VLEVLYHRVNCQVGGARISPAAGAAKNVELVCCLSVTLLNDGDSAYDFAMQALEYRKG